MSDEKRPVSEVLEEEPKPTPESVENDPLSNLSGPPKEVSGKRYAPQHRWRVLVVALVIAALLGGALYAALGTDLLRQPEVSEPEESVQPALDPLVDKSGLGEDPVASVSIRWGTAEYTVQKNADGLMTVADFADLPRQASAVDSLLSAVTTVTPASQVLESATDAELAACGLAEPEAFFTAIYADGDTFSLDIGHLEPGENAHYYARRPGETTVYLVEASLYQQITKPATDYLATMLTAAPAPASDDDAGTAKLDRLTLSGTLRDKTVVLRHTESDDPSSIKMAGNYILQSPYVRAVNTDFVSPWETGLSDTTASGVAAVYPTGEQLAAFGLDHPHSVATLTFAVYPGSATDASAEPTYTEPYNYVSYTLSLGDLNANGEYYVMVDGIDVVYTVAANEVPWAESTFGDLCSSTLFLHYITEVSDLSLTVNGATSVVHLTHSGTDVTDASASLTATVGDKTLTEADTRSLYQLMMLVKRLSPSEPTDKPSGSPELVLRLSFLDTAQTDETFSFYPLSANRYLCVAADGDAFPVKAADVESLLTQIDRYLSGETVQT